MSEDYPPTDVVIWDPQQATTWVQGQVTSPSQSWKGMCLALTANAYGFSGAGVNSAADWWHQQHHQHPGDRNVPPGGLACFTGGGSGFGHIMTSVGGGQFVSNDIRRTGKADYCTIADIERAWGQRYVGWAEPCYWAGWGRNPDAAPAPMPQAQPAFPMEAIDMFVGQDQSTGKIYLVSGNTKLEFPGGGNPDGSDLYVGVLLDMIQQAYPDAPAPHLVALNPDVAGRIPTTA